MIMQRRAWVAVAMSASFILMAWRVLMVLPKVTRSRARASDISSMRWHMPRFESAMCTREMASECMATSMPWPSLPSRYFGSSFTSVILKPACPAPRQPIICGMSTSSKPSASMGTKKAERRSSPSLSGSVTAMT